MIALITGSKGFAGEYLVQHLQDYKIASVGFDLADGNDIRDYEQIRAAISQVRPDLVFHLAAQAYVAEANSDPVRAFEVNCQGTVNLLEAVRRVGLIGTRVHVAGTSEEYGWHDDRIDIDEQTIAEPTTIYGASKLCASVAARAYGEHHGMPVIVTRATNHTGPRQSPAYAVSSFARRVALMEAGKLDVLEHGDLSGYRDMLDVRDVVRAYVLAILADPGVYNIASQHSRKIGDILHDLAAISRLEAVALKQTDTGHGKQRSVQVHFWANKLTDATAWEPLIPWEQTLCDLLNYWREQL